MPRTIAVPDFVRNDPAYFEAELAGQTWPFWICLRGEALAQQHGVDITQVTGTDQAMVMMWMANLPFNPDCTLEAFRAVWDFVPPSAFMRLCQALNAQAAAQSIGGDDQGES
jgi:hypothetical protein